MGRETSGAGGRADSPRAVVYCMVPRDLAPKLYELLRRHFDGDPSIEVIVEHRAGDRPAIEIEHPAADQGRNAAGVAMGDIAAFRHLRRAEAVERAEDGGFGGALGFAVIDEIDHHRDAERVGEEDELLALVAAHLARFGQDLDRLKPLRLGQLDLFDEGVEMANEAQHDLPQPRVRRRGKPRQYLGGDVVLVLVAVHWLVSFDRVSVA